MAETVTAVIVTYFPDVSGLLRLLAAVVPQVQDCVIVDNGSGGYFGGRLRKEFPAVRLIELGENAGIARAQNVGTQHARAGGAAFVLYLDQDSVPDQNMVANLRSAHALAKAAGFRVAAVGPNSADRRQVMPSPFLRVQGLRRIRVNTNVNDAFVPVDHLVASGSLVGTAALDVVGGMNEDLFIDYVDIEWAMRAMHRGLQSFGVGNALMSHSLGDAPIYFLGKAYPVRSPLRHYYMFRNATWLYRQPYLPLNWKLVDGWSLMLKFFFYSLFAPSRMTHMRMMLRGIRHGFMNHLGRHSVGHPEESHAV